MHFADITDVRDGLTPALRETLSILQAEINGRHFVCSSKILRIVADILGTDLETVYDLLVDTTCPRSNLPLIEGHGFFGFPVAHPDFSEIRLSDFCVRLLHSETVTDFSRPLPMPVPYALVNGTIGYSHSISKIPTHNLGEVIDATVAFIRNPKLETKDILQFIKGPDLPVGGTIENFEDLHDIYRSGQGIIRVIVDPDATNDHIDTLKDYCTWYGMRARKIRNRNAYRLEVPYHAFLWDGAQTRFMSLKDILQSYIDYCKSAIPSISAEALCLSLLKYKDLSSARITDSHLEH